MSKDFEQAYRELAESEIPDLWDRIEAGLGKRSTPKQAEGKEVVFSGSQHRKRKWVHFHRYSAIAAAAAVCVAVILPAAVFLFKTTTKVPGHESTGMAGTAKGIEMATEGIDTAAEQNEVLPFAADEEESSEAATEEMDAGEAGGMAEVLEDLAEPAENKEMSLARGQEAVKQESDMSDIEAEGDSDPAGEFTEGVILEHVVVKVAEVKNVFEREDGSLPGTLYTVMIRKDASGQLAEGEELTVDVPANSSIALLKDGVFEVDLIYKGNGIFGLEGYHQQIEE